MAQRTIHYLLGELLLEEGIPDPERFRMGNLLPDAYQADGVRRVTHFSVKSPETGEKHSDFEAFRKMFPEKIKTDSLYLGYYLHLVEDACFRVFWKDQGKQDRIRNTEDISYLHRDYHLLNRRIVEKYGLVNRAVLPSAFAEEPINRIYPFCPEELLRELEADFGEQTEGETMFLTEPDLEKFIAFALPVCRRALEGIRRDEPVDPMELCW